MPQIANTINNISMITFVCPDPFDAHTRLFYFHSFMQKLRDVFERDRFISAPNGTAEKK